MNDALGYFIEYTFPLRRDFVATPQKVELMDKEFLQASMTYGIQTYQIGSFIFVVI